MSSEVTPTAVKIMEKEYRIACHPNEEEALITSANYLDSKMREIRKSGKVVGVERIAVMAALNITHELMQKQQSQGLSGDSSIQIEMLYNKISSFLDSGNSPTATLDQ